MEPKNDETIVTDISEEVVEQPALSAREATMQGILDNREEEVRELENGLVDPQPEAEPEIEEEAIEDEFVEVKVNGRVYDVEAAKIEQAGGVEAYQRNAAASEKLRLAADHEAALKRKEEELAELERRLLNTEHEKTASDDGEFGKQFADQVFDDPEAVAATMNELNERTRKAEEAASMLLARDQKREQQERQTIVEYFHENHVAIASDQEFTDALNARTVLIAAENPGFSPQQVIDKAAEQVYAKFHISKGGMEQQETVETKRVRKPIKTPPRATSRKPPTPEVKTKTPDEVVRGLAQNRTPQRH